MDTVPESPLAVRVGAFNGESQIADESGITMAQSEASMSDRAKRSVSGAPIEEAAFTRSSSGSSHGRRRRATVEGQPIDGHSPLERSPSESATGRRTTIEVDRVEANKILPPPPTEVGTPGASTVGASGNIYPNGRLPLLSMASDPEIHAGTKPHFWKLVTAKSENFRVSSGDASNSPHALRNKWRNAISFSRTGSYHKFAGSGVFRMVQMATRIGHFGKHHEEEEAPSPQISAEEAERKAQIRTTTQNLQHVMKRVAEHSRADLHAAVQAEDEVFEAFPASGSPGQSPPLSPLVRRSGSQGAIEQELRELDSELKEVGGASRFSSLSAPMSGESSPVNTSRQRGGSATDSLLPDPEVSPGPQWQDSPRGTRRDRKSVV